jgi:dTDP-4-amino-4,6-dideoxygalactose transaminase
MREDFLVFGAPVIEQEEIAEVVDSLRSGWIGTGPKVQRFERMLEAYLGVEHVRCLSSCTAALMLGLKSLEIGPGDEVIVPAMTFVATANAVEHTGAQVVFVDSEPRTGLMDLAAAEAALTSRTRAIVPVHFAGRPLDLDAVARLAARHGLSVLEDAAHAIGAEWRGRKVGAFGNAAAFSFYPTKNITTIEGGALVATDPTFAEKIERLALHGLSVGAWQRFSDVGFKHYEATEPGFKFNMTDVEASLGLHQLPRLDRWVDARAARWQRYDELLRGLPLALPPPAEERSRHARHMYQVLVGDDAPASRDEILDRLHAQRIGAGVHYRGVHLHPYYQQRYGVDPASLPVATDWSKRTLSLPLSPALEESDQKDVADALRSALSMPGRSADRRLRVKPTADRLGRHASED